MKKSICSIMGLTILMALTSCKDLEGTLSLNESITLQNDSRDEVNVPAGQHRADLKVNSKRKVNLEIKIGDEKQTFVFKTDQNLKKIKSGDRIQISGEKSGQGVDIDGIYSVTQQSTGTTRSIESCTYTTVEWRCRLVTTPASCQVVRECNPQNPSQCSERNVCRPAETREVCGNETVSHSGRHEVEYFYTTTTEAVDLTVLKQARSVGQMRASDSETNKHYTYQGICR